MTYVLQVLVDPGLEAGLGSVVPMVVVDQDHNKTLQGPRGPFFERTDLQSYLRICKDTFIH